MSDEFFGGTDPFKGARTPKRNVVDINEPEERNTIKNDITKSDMFKEFFGEDAAKQFQKLEEKREREKVKIIEVKPASKNPMQEEVTNEPDSSGSKR